MQKILAKNKKARHDFEILEVFEAGIVLKGHEAKALREGGGNFTGSYVSIDDADEVWVKKFNIQLYSKANLDSYEPDRPRKLLLRKVEIQKIAGALNTQGVTVVPLSCGLVQGKIKIEVALARGKKKVDKRHDLKKRDQERRIRASLNR